MFNLKIARRLGVAHRYDHVFRPIRSALKNIHLKLRNNPKIVVIGFNKTGTTSLFYALEELGYKMSNQHDFERLYNIYKQGEIKIDDILKKINQYEVFQDIPFSLPGFYETVDNNFPNCKYILTIRSESDVWFKSFEKYYGDLEKIKNDKYIEEGFLYRTFRDAYNSEGLTKEDCKRVYEKHMADVMTYFKSKKDRLLVIDVSEEKSYLELCSFLNKKPLRQNFLWKNKTKA